MRRAPFAVRAIHEPAPVEISGQGAIDRALELRKRLRDAVTRPLSTAGRTDPGSLGRRYVNAESGDGAGSGVRVIRSSDRAHRDDVDTADDGSGSLDRMSYRRKGSGSSDVGIPRVHLGGTLGRIEFEQVADGYGGPAPTRRRSTPVWWPRKDSRARRQFLPRITSGHIAEFPKILARPKPGGSTTRARRRTGCAGAGMGRFRQRSGSRPIPAGLEHAAVQRPLGSSTLARPAVGNRAMLK